MEHAGPGMGKRAATARRQASPGRPPLTRAAFVVALAVAAMAGARADLLPTGPRVVSGAAAVSTSGRQQTVQQYSDRAIIEWDAFSIGAKAGVRFVQPRSTSVVLNRVVGDDPSQILGSMSANGRVFLVNPHGVFFGAGARVDTGGLAASTLAIADDDFLSGRFLFTRGAGTGRVENAGAITVRDGGFVLLAADDVRNSGRITAPGGAVMLASAERVTIDTRADGLVGFSVSGRALREVARVSNSGTIAADGGSIALSARGARELTGMVVNNTGVLRAASIQHRDGAVILSADAGTTSSSGSIDVSGARGGLIEVGNASGTARVEGRLDATGRSGRGGDIRVAGATTTGVMAGARVDASGKTGGAVRIGGDWRGEALALPTGEITSTDTYVAQSATLASDGRGGAGGSVVVWAERNARFDGKLSARGAGDAAGGQAEISGRQHLDLRGGADLGSERGASGTLLLDPERIRITDSAGDGEPGNPAGGADGDLPEIFAGDPGGTSTVSRGKLESLAGNANIVLEATREVRLDNLASNQLSLATGSGNSVTLRTTAAGSSIVFADLNDRISTDGGAIHVDSAGSVGIGKLASSGGAVSVRARAGAASVAGIESGGGSVEVRASAAAQPSSIASGGGAVTLEGASVTAGTIRSDGGSVNVRASNVVGYTSIASGGGAVTLEGASVTAGTIQAGNADVRFKAGTTAVAGNIQTDGTVRFEAGSVSQKAGTRIRAGRVAIAKAGSVTLDLNNEVTRFAATTTGATTFKSVRDLTVEASTVQGASLDVRSTGKITVDGALRVDGGTGTASLHLEAAKGIAVGSHNVTVQGRGGYGARAANLTLRATDGDVTQSGGNITATATGTRAASTSQLAHSAEVTLSADDGRVTVQTVSARSVDGRAQVSLNGHDGVTVGARAEAVAASQPGVVINAQHNKGNADVDTRGATVRTVLTAETAVRDAASGSTSYKYVSKPVEDIGGIGIAGRNLRLGDVEAVAGDALRASRAGAASLAGISTQSHGNTTFHGTVRTDSLVGINAGTSDDGTIVTDGGILRGPALSLSGDAKVYGRGVFRLTTDVGSLTVVGGRGVDIDNTSHGGQLVINALGRISPETTLPGGEVAEATTMPVGGFRIRSRDVKLLSLDNRTQSTWQYDGAGTSGNRQDFVFEADRLEVVPGTIKTRVNTLVHLRPLTSTRRIVIGQDATHPDASVTYYSGGTFGLLGMLHPESKVYIGNYGDQTGYTGDILVGGTTPVHDIAKQVSLGSMELHFYTAGTGRVINNYGSNDALPPPGPDGLTATEAVLLCVSGQACLPRMTDKRVYVRDSRMEGETRVQRYVWVAGKGTGLGGTRPEDERGVDSSGGGGSGPGGGAGGGGGGGGSGDGDGGGSGGSAPPPPGSGGGGSDETNAPGDVGPVVGNPGPDNGNPGTGPVDPTDPPDASGPGADPGGDGGLSGGGEWSGDPDAGGPGGGGTPGGPGDPGGPTGPGGGGAPSDPGGPTGPGGGGTPSDPGGSTGPGGGGTPSDPGGSTGPGGGGMPSDPGGSTGPGGGGTPSDPGGSTGPGGGGTPSDPGGSTGPGGGGTPSDPGGSTGPGGGGESSDPGGSTGPGGGGESSDPGGATGPGGGGASSDPGGPGGGAGGGDSGGSSDPSGPGGSTGGGGTSDPGNAPGGPGDPWLQPGEPSGGAGGGGEFSGDPGSGPGAGGGSGGAPGSGSGSSGGGGPGAGNGSGGGASGGGGTADGGGASGGGAGDPGASSGGTGGGGSGSGGAGGAEGDGGFGGGGAPGGDGAGGSDYTGDGAAGGGTGSGGSGTGGTGDTGGTGGTGGTGAGSGSADPATGGSGGSGAGGEGNGAGTGDGSGGGNGQGQGQSGEGGSGSGSGEGAPGGASGEGGGDDASADGQAPRQGTAKADDTRAEGEEEEFVGGASGGGRAQAGVEDRDTASTQPPPPCEDESPQVRALSRAGETSPGLLSAQGPGVRLRNESGTLPQQRSDCAQLRLRP